MAPPSRVTRCLRAETARVWHVMATAGALARYHPFCVQNPVTRWPGLGAEDAIHYLSGRVLHRRFTAWDEGRGYTLEIGPSKGPTSTVRWELQPVSAQESELTISIWPAAFSGYPRAVAAVLHRWYLRPVLCRYLDRVLKGLEYFLTTGRDVQPNQFGRVWLFS